MARDNTRDPSRRAAVVETLESTKLHAFLCHSPSEILMLTGYWPVMGTSLAAVTHEGRTCVVVPEDEYDLARATTDAELIRYKPQELDSLVKTSESLVAPLKELAARLHLNAGKIGIGLHDAAETSSYQSATHFRVYILPLLRYAIPGIAIAAADSSLEKLKSIKTRVELDRIRHAARLAASGFGAAKHAIAAGRREDEVAADIESAFARDANDGFERGRGYFFCMSGPNSATADAAYARTRRRVIEEGDLVMIHANTVGDGYWTDITRTYVVGSPTDRQLKMREAIIEARAAALNAIRPGARAASVDAAAREVLESRGFGHQFTHATGHGVGFAAADSGAVPRIHAKSTDILEPGMTFNIEPAIYFKGEGGMRHCDMVACSTSGVEVLTDY